MIDEKDVRVLKSIIDYCDRIERTMTRFGKVFEAFENDIDYINSISMNILQIGEFAGRLSHEYVSATVSKINWRAIKAMRNIFAHNYGAIDVETVWETAINDVPALKNFCENEII